MEQKGAYKDPFGNLLEASPKIYVEEVNQRRLRLHVCLSNLLFFLLQHLLPLNVISSSSLSVVYNVADFGNRRLAYTASYAFQNEETCGPRRISSPLGKFANL